MENRCSNCPSGSICGVESQDRSPRPLSFSSFLLEDSGRVGDRCFDFDQIFRYARAEDVKRLEVFEEFVTKRDETGKQGRNRNRWTHLRRN